MGIDDIGREENASFFNIFGHVPRLSFSLFAKYYVTVGKISTGGFAFHPEGQEKCAEKPFFWNKSFKHLRDIDEMGTNFFPAL